ncbi:MAG: hypothetical protein Q7U74_16140 [Saprospiraceae bacterium]|nr:hypothetical protein [Saprospiraceae bacterium]
MTIINGVNTVARRPSSGGLAEVRNALDDISKLGYLASPLEQAVINKRLYDLRARHIRTVASAANNALTDKAERLKRQRQRLDEFIASEMRSWDPVRFSAELGIASVLLDMAAKSQDPDIAIKNLMSDAVKSSDRYKIRAITETIPGAAAKFTDIDARLKINNVLYKGQEALKEIRNTTEIQGARQVVKQAYDEFASEREQFEMIAQDMGESTAGGIFGDTLERWRPVMRDGVPDILDAVAERAKDDEFRRKQQGY